MRLLWHFMGTSPAYTVFTGLVEVVGGLLLFSRRTTTLGALILAAAFANVTLLNFGYDVGVQLNTTIYALMAMALLAPDLKRLASALLADPQVTAGPRRLSPWISGLTKASIVVAIIAIHFHDAYRGRSVVAAPLPALYGIYDVEDFERDGVRVPAGDGTRWRRFVIGERASGAIQLTPHSPLALFNVTDDPDASVLRLTGRTKGSPVLTFQYARSADGLLEIVGRVDDHLVRARLKAIDVRQLPLLRPRR